MSRNNQDVTMVVDFTVAIDSRIWDDGDEEIIFKGNDGFTFFDADFISENDGVVIASVKGESDAVWSTPQRVTDNFDDISESFDTQIFFGSHPAAIMATSLYTVREYGI